MLSGLSKFKSLGIISSCRIRDGSIIYLTGKAVWKFGNLFFGRELILAGPSILQVGILALETNPISVPYLKRHFLGRVLLAINTVKMVLNWLQKVLRMVEEKLPEVYLKLSQYLAVFG